MNIKIKLTDLPFDKFVDLIQNYDIWIEEIEKTVFMYIEINRTPIAESEKLVRLVQKKSSIDTDRVQRLLEECACSPEIKNKIKALYQSDSEEEKEWIVFYNHMDVGHRVKAKKYTEALLAAYTKYGADGKITKVEEVKN